jgi:UDP-N-acetylglucosamine 2-epimerase (non-hydrolysing)
MKVAVVLGTRPEAIKLAPVIEDLRRDPERVTCIVVNTGQHRDMAIQALAAFGLRPDVDLGTMRAGQSLGSLTSRLFHELDEFFARGHPDWVLVQGDTTSAMVAATTAFYHRIPIGHVEAGLRTYDRLMPFPEEINRTFIGHVADLHFAPTEGARDNLLRSGVDRRSILVTGNTVVDAVHRIRSRISSNARKSLLDPALLSAVQGKRLILITSHRRESFGPGIENICRALREIVRRFEDAVIIFPVHLNPKVQDAVYRTLGNAERIHLLKPVGYLELMSFIERAHIVLTDSGGLQEEVPSFGKPILILRDLTERPEVVEAGCARLVGTCTSSIVNNTSELMNVPQIYLRMANAGNPFGDGHASERIVARLLDQRREITGNGRHPQYDVYL